MNKEIIPDFFNYQFKYKRKEGEFINIAQKSVNQSSINQSKLKNLDFVLPPLSTQQAIVSKIEELFSELDKSIESLKTAQQQLKTYRQAVLKWAFEGRFTSPSPRGEGWGEVKEGELPEGWKVCTLGQVCEMKAGTFIKANEIKDEFNEGHYPCYGGNGLRGYTKDYTHQGEYSLIGRQGALCGNVHIVNGMFYATEHAVVVTSKESVNTRWLFYKLTQMKLNQFSSGVAQPGLSVNKLIPIEIIVPQNKDVQSLIVQEIESRLSVCDKLEDSITQSLQQAEALRQSILKKAFEGKLV